MGVQTSVRTFRRSVAAAVVSSGPAGADTNGFAATSHCDRRTPVSPEDGTELPPMRQHRHVSNTQNESETYRHRRHRRATLGVFGLWQKRFPERTRPGHTSR